MARSLSLQDLAFRTPSCSRYWGLHVAVGSDHNVNALLQHCGSFHLSFLLTPFGSSILLSPICSFKLLGRIITLKDWPAKQIFQMSFKMPTILIYVFCLDIRGCRDQNGFPLFCTPNKFSPVSLWKRNKVNPCASYIQHNPFFFFLLPNSVESPPSALSLPTASFSDTI